MKRILSCLVSIFILVSTASDGSADENRSIKFNIDLDMRSRIASTGTSQAGIYEGTFGFRAKLMDGLHFNYAHSQNNAYIINGFGRKVKHDITQEAALEKSWRSGERLQLGIVRLPFGLYNSQETYTSGLIDYPLVRGDYALQSVNWGVPGVRFGGGSSQIQGEVAVFGGQSSGVWNNLNNTRGVDARVQLYRGNTILGLSHWAGSSSTDFHSPGEQVTHVSGLDIRYTLPRLVLRGEYMLGKLAGDNLNGWYLDAYYRLPKYEKMTLVARVEQFKPGSDEFMSKQITLGARYTLTPEWILAMNWRRNNGKNYPTWTPGTRKGGDVFFQVYRKLSF